MAFGIFFIITLSGIVTHFARYNVKFGSLKFILASWNKPIKREDQTFMRYKQPIKIEKPLQWSRRFSLIVYQKNHAGFFKAHIMVENKENKKQLKNIK